jgi:sigma-B regulation protein RsbU (phosphoserine phosphatase)
MMRTLRTKILVLLGSILVVTVSLLVWSGRQSTEEAIWAQVRSDAEYLGAILEQVIELMINDPDQLEQTGRLLELDPVNQVLRKGNVLVKPLLVLNQRLEPLAGSRPEGAPALVLGEDQVKALKQTLRTGEVVGLLSADSADLYKRWRSRDGRHQGAFIASFSRKGLDDLVARQERTMLGLGLAALLVTLPLGWWFSRRITQPLSLLATTARRVGRGEFQELAQLDAMKMRRDELGRLGHEFHEMATQVRDREQLLEREVMQRTRELAERNAALQAAQSAIDRDLAIAKALQLGVLPAGFPRVPHLEGAAQVLMQQQMGGDFYDFIELADGRLALVIADVSGKGLAAAFFMAMTRTSLAVRIRQQPDPAKCLALVNDDLVSANPLDMFVTLFLAVLDPARGELLCANGGHNPPICLRADGRVEICHGRGDLALGIMPCMAYGLDRMVLNGGDTLLMYTDGVTDAINGDAADYGMARLQTVVAQHAGVAPGDLLNAVLRDVDRFAEGSLQFDDITLSVVRRSADG